MSATDMGASDMAATTAAEAPGAHQPQLRTILLTDLCDSLSLVERLGDGAAAELFRAHDRLVLQLQQQWRGRLIDRSDGLLLLFERPIDGLGFALDYVRGLHALGTERQLTLKARAGLHVGEVLTWRNSDEAVRVGAKPLEVEGLAKPTAARLMASARPGQILLSAVAEPLAHRSARELGERGQHLLWKSYGRWRFKGVPDPQEIFEVGEPGLAPLRAPPNTPKAWRDTPLWRRPLALLAEAAAIAVIGIGVWFVTRPQPAIAFAERDWVVVADLRNLTGQPVLDDSLEQAFRISLEQSRYVNVLSDLKARDTLARMQRKPDTVLDRAIASEIALRDGARAVILPTVAEVGGRVRVSAEVIDPHTQTTVYAESADGKGTGSALASIDEVTAGLREKLGEAVKVIERDSVPLPQVTTKNLDALRAYALGQKAYSHSDLEGAQRLYQSATQLDPQFALAWLGQMRVQFGLVNAPAAVIPLRRAQALRDHLAPREALYMDAWATDFDAPAQTVSKWVELAKLYPDYWPAQGNAALWMYESNRFREGLPYAKAATTTRYELAAVHEDTLGRLLLGLEQYRYAGDAFGRSIAHGTRSTWRRVMMLKAAQRDFVAARRASDRLQDDDRHAHIERTSIAIDQGQWVRAQAIARAGLQRVSRESGFDRRMFLMPLAVSEWLMGERGAALDNAQAAAARALSALSSQKRDADQRDDAPLALASALFAQRLGDRTTARKVVDGLKAMPELMAIPSVAELAIVLKAQEERLSGHPRESLSLLQPLLTGNERYQTHVALLDAYVDAGEIGAAIEQARWLQRHRGLAYVELTCGHCLQALNVADSNIAMVREAELLERAGRTAEAEKMRSEVGRLWPADARPGQAPR